MLSVFITDPQFQGQTKDKLTSVNAQKLVESAVRDYFDHWLSGAPDAVGLVAGKLKCKRIVPLKVSGAFHSPFMSKAADTFSLQLDDVIFNDAIVPVLSNADPTPSVDGELLRKRLQCQMISGVRWRETMNNLENLGIETLLEIGPGKVLSGLAKRSIKGVNLNQLSSASDLGHSS